jgi:tetratricopeptide (TPR) repeat protein
MSDSWRTTYDDHLKRIQDYPEDGEGWLAFGKFLEEDCIAPDKALRAFQNAHRLLANDETLLRLGSAYVDAGAAASGIELLRSACDQFPSAHAFAFLADAEMKVKNYGNARTALDSGFHLDPEFDELYFLYGESFRRATEYREAIEWYRKAIQIDSSDWRYWQALGH